MGLNAKANSFSPLTQEHAMLFQKKEPTWRWLETKNPIVQGTEVYQIPEGVWISVGLSSVSETTMYCAITSQVLNEKRSVRVRSRVEEGRRNPHGQYDARRQLGEVASSNTSWACHCRQWSFGFAYRSTVVVNVCSSMDTCEAVSKQQRK